MNIEVRQLASPRAAQPARHHRLRLPSRLHASSEMRAVPDQSVVELLADLRQPSRHGYAKGYAYPKIAAAGRAPRRLAAGRRPAGERSRFLQQQHLDFYGIERGDHEPAVAHRAGRPERRALRRAAPAANEWQLAHWTDHEPRLKASIVVPYEDGDASAAEIAQARRQQELRPGAAAEPHRRGRWAAGATGRSTRRRSRPDCRSASMPSAIAAGR